MNYIKIILIGVNSVIACAAFYALFRYKTLSAVLKVVSWYIFLTAVIQIPYTILAFQHRNNLFLLHLDVLLGFMLQALFYALVLKQFITPVIVTVIAILFSMFTIFNSIWLQPYHSEVNSYALTVQSVIVVIFSLSTFIVLLNDAAKEAQQETRISVNWINSGLFIYYASSLLIFYFSNFSQNSFSEMINRYAWLANCFFLTIMYIFFIVGLWKHHRASTF